jgi:UDP-N-acetylglucosamine pyrophosphorylase
LNASELNPQLVSQLVSEGVDLDAMLVFLDELNAGKYDDLPSIKPESVPDLSHPAIVDRRSSHSWRMSVATALARFQALGLPFSPESLATARNGYFEFDESSLRKIGIHLYPKAAYGVLNGGSASSYADIKKNSALDAASFARHRDLFDALAAECRGKPKGITPAYINPDGSPGYSFLYLKLRMLLEHKRLYRDVTGKSPRAALPAFQMTSVLTDKAINETFRDYVMDPGLRDLANELDCPSIELYTECQSMMAAITHSSEGKPRRIFDRAGGKEHTGIAMPGGHGQNFRILAPIYRKLYAQGVRYIWIGNIDNMGYTVDPVGLAMFALSGKDAVFEESFRTPMDVKGGILVSDRTGRLTCADIGPAISTQEMLAFEAAGKPVLFNCGIGLFDLEKLVARLPSIPYELPLRITDQDKDAGKYAQAEQITWEIIGLLDNPLFFAVEKNRRFIAAKMLLETILTSKPGSGAEGEVARGVHEGLVSLFASDYGLSLHDNRWILSN